VVADIPEPEPRRNPKTRIAGRVVDDQGEPVPNVTVRLADGGTKGGKDIQATTDRSGGFTLNGLRPGSSYWLVAEGEDSKGPLTGRIQARTADTDVEISLLAEGSGSSTTSRQSARPSRAKPVSNREELDPAAEESQSPKVNREDLLPPADDAGAIDPGPPPPPQSGRPKLSSPEPTVGWRNGNSAKSSRPRSQDQEIASTSSDDSPRTRRATTFDPPASDEDGPNPLPPAINPDAASSPDDSIPARSSSTRRPAKSKRWSRRVARPPRSNPTLSRLRLSPRN
jgi:hypothetical protein